MTVAISTKPWSDFTAADYSLEQWHKACLIHLHTSGADYTKEDCKLPIREPDGKLNRNGIQAAAAALAGARGGVNAPPEEKAKARQILVQMYKQMGDMPPDSMMHSGTLAIQDVLDNFLAHAGVKGMKWRKHKPKVPDNTDSTANFTKAGQGLNLPLKNTNHDPSASKGDKAWADKVLHSGNKLQKMQQQAHENFRKRFKEMLSEPRFKGVAELLKDPANKGNPKLKQFYAAAKKERDAIWNRQAQAAFGPSPSNSYTISVKRNPDGTVTAGLVKVEKSKKIYSTSGSGGRTVAHSDILVDNFLVHFGIRGMRWGVRHDRGPDGTVASNPKAQADFTDAQRAAKTLATIKKDSSRRRSGLENVSNADLQHLINRMNLEKQFADFDKSQAAKLDRQFNKVLKYGGTLNKAIAFANSPGGRLISQSLRGTSGGGKHAAIAKGLIPKEVLPGKGKKKKNK